MTLIIVLMLLLGYLLIATGHLTGVNKAAIAMFIGTIGWVVYICWGTDFVMAQHPHEYAEFLAGEEPSSDAVKYYIYNEIFLNYVGRAASIVMFLLATMSIIEILNNNGCFDFIQSWIKTRNPKRLLWTITFATFVISANLDNLTTATMMLVIMRGIVPGRGCLLAVPSSLQPTVADALPSSVIRQDCCFGAMVPSRLPVSRRHWPYLLSWHGSSPPSSSTDNCLTGLTPSGRPCRIVAMIPT